jgi:ArsR family transcriptional regulator, arsenate/arsenite/antimonite-responsive transcriptional repressor
MYHVSDRDRATNYEATIFLRQFRFALLTAFYRTGLCRKLSTPHLSNPLRQMSAEKNFRLTNNLFSGIHGQMSNHESVVSRFAEVFKALSNPNRLRIFLRLVSCCPPGTKCNPELAVRRCVSELGKGLEIDPSTVSHHLKELRQSGLIRMERRGKNIECWVDPDMVLAAANLLTRGSIAGPPDTAEAEEGESDDRRES